MDLLIFIKVNGPLSDKINLRPRMKKLLEESRHFGLPYWNGNLGYYVKKACTALR